MTLEDRYWYSPAIDSESSRSSMRRVRIGLRLLVKSERFLNCPVSIPDPTGRRFMISQLFSTSLPQRHSTLVFGPYSRVRCWKHGWILIGYRGRREHIIGLLLHAGQPFADTSLFAANAVCQRMRRHVTVALSGDGGDEGFGGYDLYWQIARIARLQRLPEPIWHMAPIALLPLARVGLLRDSLPQTIATLNGADDTAVVQRSFRWVQEDEHKNLCQIADVLPVRRLLERQWEHHLPPRASRIEILSAHATEVNTRLMLSNDFLFKVDTASMRE